jgi:hypothetical protein
MVIGTIVAIAVGWPAQLGGPGDAENVAAEALSRGTALSPPAAPVVVYAIALWLATRRRVAGTVGTVLLMVLSLVFMAGGLGETFAPSTPDVPRAVLVLSGVVATLLGGAVILAGGQRLRGLRASSTATPEAWAGTSARLVTHARLELRRRRLARSDRERHAPSDGR